MNHILSFPLWLWMLLSALIGLINFFILYWSGRKKEKNYIKE